MGINKMDDPKAKGILEDLIMNLNLNSIYLVPVGELENFVPSINGHGNEWVDKVLNQYPDFSDPVYNVLTTFINDIDIQTTSSASKEQQKVIDVTDLQYSVIKFDEVIKTHPKMLEQYLVFRHRHKIPYVIDGRHAGKFLVVYSDPSKAERELGWRAEYGVNDEMVQDSWNWHKRNPNGFD